jgi:hypothetical protein
MARANLPSGLLGLTPSLPEAGADARAQLAAVADVTAKKDSAFFPPGSRRPRPIPVGTQTVSRPEGTLVTANPAKATLFAKTPQLDDAKIARLLGYPQSKLAAVASGRPAVVQAVAHGGVAHESLASPAGLVPALLAARRAVPQARLRVVSPVAAVARRVGLLGNMPMKGGMGTI